jgi:hypothetical protein
MNNLSILPIPGPNAGSLNRNYDFDGAGAGAGTWKVTFSQTGAVANSFKVAIQSNNDGGGLQHDVDNIAVEVRDKNGNVVGTTGPFTAGVSSPVTGGGAFQNWTQLHGATVAPIPAGYPGNGGSDWPTVGTGFVWNPFDEITADPSLVPLLANGTNTFRGLFGTSATLSKGYQIRISMQDDNQFWSTGWQDVTPEPSTLVLAAPALAPLGLLLAPLGLFGSRRRRRETGDVEEEL